MDEAEDKFQILVHGHKAILYRICQSYCRSAADREDLAQEILVQLWRAFPSFDARCRFSTWMYRIALNVAISHLRRETTRARYLLSSEEHVLEAAAPPEPPRDELRMLYAFIEELDPLNRALMLLYLEDASYGEIAEVLGITETNVATKINRLKQKMKQRMGAAAAN